MNFLGHAYLSFKHPEILTGNLISDFVKGSSRYNYPEGVQKGITLHRDIDAFTDAHEATRLAKEIFRPHYRLYSGALVDVLYDHFLATHPESFPGSTLLPFTNEVYRSIEGHIAWLPDRFARIFTYMKTENWLLNYSKHSGIERSLRGLVHRARYLSDSETAFQLYLQNYSTLQELAAEFLPDVKRFAKERFNTLVL